MGESSILAELEIAKDGKGVQVEFTKVDGVISHTILLGDGNERVPVLTSRINAPGQPCFTELHQQDELLFLTGADGPCHWSMSVQKGQVIFKHEAKIDQEALRLLEKRYGLNAPHRADADPLGEVLHFDIACRLKGPVADLRSDYYSIANYRWSGCSVMDPAHIQAGVIEVGPIKGTAFVPTTCCSIYWDSEREIHFAPKNAEVESYPATLRWSYSVWRVI